MAVADAALANAFNQSNVYLRMDQSPLQVPLPVPLQYHEAGDGNVPHSVLRTTMAPGSCGTNTTKIFLEKVPPVSKHLLTASDCDWRSFGLQIDSLGT